MREAADQDPLRAKLHQQILRAAEGCLQQTMIAHVLVGPRMLDQSRKALAEVTTCAMAFRLSGDRRFLARAKEVMLTAAAFPDWNPSHFLDVAEMATAVALGYDWLFDELSVTERNTLKAALLEKALQFVEPAYSRADPRRESFPFVGNNLHNNWNQVCNGGFLLAALAIAEDEPRIARRVINGVRETLPYAVAGYAPDGAYPEGPVYWGYGTRYNVMILAALESALGRDFGLGALPAFDRTALYRLYVESPIGLSFNYADGRPGLGADSGLTWLGHHYNLPAAVAHSRTLLAESLEKPPAPTDRFLATHALWFPADVAAPAPLPLDAHFKGPSEITVFRSAWHDRNAIWVGFKAGGNRVNHGHLDLGSFVLDADGQRWAADLGPDDYDLPGYWESETRESRRWQYYRLNNLSHNTVTPNAALQSPDAVATMTRFSSTAANAFAVADLSQTFPEQVSKVLRGVALLNRSRVLVQDELENLKPGTILTWQMLTAAQVTVDGAHATLTLNGRTLVVDILSPSSAKFRARRAVPPTPAENQNEGMTSLFAEITPDASMAGDLRIAVLLSPTGDHWPKLSRPEVIPLHDWK